MWSLLDKKYVVYCKMYLKMYTFYERYVLQMSYLIKISSYQVPCAHMQHNVIQITVKFLLEPQTERKMVLD